jgi:hypothetical protein
MWETIENVMANAPEILGDYYRHNPGVTKDGRFKENKKLKR